jgi:hypothetical protein
MYNIEDEETQVVEKRRLEKDLSALLSEVETKMGLNNMHFRFWHSGNARRLSPQVKAYNMPAHFQSLARQGKGRSPYGLCRPR